MRTLVLAAAVFLLAGSALADEYKAIFWNLQSGESSDSVIATQMVAKGDIDVWGLSEVSGQNALDTFVTALKAANPGKEFTAKLSLDGDSDRLALIVRTDRLAPVAYSGSATVEQIGGEFFEVNSINVGGTIRPGLGVQLESSDGDRVIVLVNHWKCCGDAPSLLRRRDQATQMNAFAVSSPGIPIVAGGDFNIPLNNDGRTQEAFLALIARWELKEPQANVGSWRGGSVLDAVFTTNRIAGWEASAAILEREGHALATTATFTDTNSSTDHRPLRLIVRSDPSERIESLREAVADTRAALRRLESELTRLEAAARD